MIGRDAKGKLISDYEKENQAQWRVGQAFDRLDDRERLAVFREIFGRFVGCINRTWKSMIAAPYAVSMHSKSHRAPDQPNASLSLRIELLLRMLTLDSTLKPSTLSLEFLAAWAPHLNIQWDAIEQEAGWVLVANLATGTADAEAAMTVFLASMHNEHPIGSMGRHVLVGLMASTRPDGWAAVGKLLLAAQRQEGLRQSIFQAAMASNPDALARLIVDNQLLRFSSVLQAFNEWLDMQWSAPASKVIENSRVRISELRFALATTNRFRLTMRWGCLTFHD